MTLILMTVVLISCGYREQPWLLLLAMAQDRQLLIFKRLTQCGTHVSIPSSYFMTLG